MLARRQGQQLSHEARLRTGRHFRALTAMPTTPHPLPDAELGLGCSRGPALTERV